MSAPLPPPGPSAFAAREAFNQLAFSDVSEDSEDDGLPPQEVTEELLMNIKTQVRRQS